MQRIKCTFLICLLLLLLFGVYRGPTVRAQGDPFALSQQKLLSAFHDVQAADSSGVSREDSSSLVRGLNSALSLQEQANDSGSSVLAYLSINQSSCVSLRAISSEKTARSGSLARVFEGYGASIVAAALTALLGVESHRLIGLMKRKIQPTDINEE